MIHFLWPWVFAVLPLPLLVRWFFPAASEAPGGAITVPFYAVLAAMASARQPATSTRWRLVMMLLLWVLLVVAAARPQQLGEADDLPMTGRDLLLAVDISGSMEMPDLTLNDKPATRLQVVQNVAGDFIARRAGDRVGLILFGKRAYLQTPLTFDRATTRAMLDEAEIGLAGKETAIGDAMGVAIKHLREQPPHMDRASAAKHMDVREQPPHMDRASAAKHMDVRERPQDSRVLVLMTDGANTAGELTPTQGATLAAQFNVRVHTIGVGADSLDVAAVMGGSRLRPRLINPSADLDEKLLKHIADTTGGKYFRARDTAGLEEIYQLLDELEPQARQDEVIRPVTEMYLWPLGVAFVLALLWGVFQIFLPSSFSRRGGAGGDGVVAAGIAALVPTTPSLRSTPPYPRRGE